MSKDKEFQHYNPETELSSTPPEIDAFLDELSNIRDSEPSPRHPDWQAKKNSAIRGLEEHFIDDQDRRTRLAAMREVAEQQFDRATAEREKNPGDIVAAVRYDVALERLSQLTTADSTEKALTAASVGVDTNLDPKISTAANEKVLETINQHWDLDTERHPTPEQKKQQYIFLLKADLPATAVQFSYIESLAEDIKWQYHLEPQSWQEIEKQFKSMKKDVAVKARDVASRLNIPQLKTLRESIDLADELESKPLELLKHAYDDVRIVQADLNEIRKFLRGMMKKQI